MQPTFVSRLKILAPLLAVLALLTVAGLVTPAAEGATQGRCSVTRTAAGDPACFRVACDAVRPAPARSAPRSRVVGSPAPSRMWGRSTRGVPSCLLRPPREPRSRRPVDRRAFAAPVYSRDAYQARTQVAPSPIRPRAYPATSRTPIPTDNMGKVRRPGSDRVAAVPAAEGRA